MPEIFGTDESDFLEGTDGIDTIFGLGGNDFITNVGDGDSVDGGSGVDSIDRLFAGDQVNRTPASDGEQRSFEIDNSGVRSTTEDRPFSITFTDIERIELNVGDVFSFSQDDTVDASGFTGVATGDTFFTPQVRVDLNAGSNIYVGSDDPDVEDRVTVRPVLNESCTNVLDGGAAGSFEVASIRFEGPTEGTNEAVDISIVATAANETTVTLENSTNTTIVRNMDLISVSVSFRFMGPVTLDGGLAVQDLSLRGGETANTLIGGAGDDRLNPTTGATDTLVGGAGDDLIAFLDGQDVAEGGAGSDAFTLQAKNFDGSAIQNINVTITDFEQQDTLSVVSFFFDGELITETYDFIGLSSFSGNGSEIRQRFFGLDTIVEYDLDGDRNADGTITLQGGRNLLAERIDPITDDPILITDRDFGSRDFSGTPLADIFVASRSADVYTFSGGDRLVGVAEQFDLDTIRNFSLLDALIFQGSAFERADVNVLRGSLILEVDADQDGAVDAVVTLEGDFSGFDIAVTSENGDTTITLVEEVIENPFNVIEATAAKEQLQATEGVDVFVFDDGDSNLFASDKILAFEAGDQLDLTAFGFENLYTGEGALTEDSIALLGGDGAVTLISGRGFRDFLLQIDGTVEDITAGLVLSAPEDALL